MTITIDTPMFLAAAPASLRAECIGLSPAEFHDRYCEPNGPVKLSDWTPIGHRAGTATLEIADHLRTVTAAGSPVAALTSALYDEGYPVEILQFHQRRTEDGTATFVQCEFNGRRGWGAALADDPAESTIRAMIAGINHLGSHF
ncbi:alpha-isopropylmalate synthase regulatory domain-containing protein [Nocardia seriolae]|uniref:alpha-isopropylmalate synthase regulatory domain-containing protein n=1 Tax=Nocardia seriolae TaxID=37332 RepID=UPI00051A13AF|nr:alpha-isopropylmalate synthase regulatory domain-containing protein [Nocardia seriolae]MTJ87404.1 2-keto-3-deoxygluconate kinase [Nocardia seriolae]MTK31396.1 2-keto-3-deoxygluconate kinase [Nocardia seriolae]MTK40455.1 2-keto-3-deoxygluconate kinase [Nocardia seriolae]OJF81449.1 2-keto-3-deoxygluconate kinase [Nocardia seriolae]PSK29667.1 2-keto-3-deoxygluconate kinase [Nocardia seriolae]